MVQQRQRQPTPIIPQNREERLFFNSLSSEYTKLNYKTCLDKYLKTVGYKEGLTELLAKQPKEIENDLIDFIISLKDRGCKHSTIINYVKPVVACCKVNDVVLNVNRVNRFIPRNVRNKHNTKSYEIPQIQAMLSIASEREQVVILLCCSGLRIGAIPDLNIGSLQEVNDIYKITVYDGEPECYVTFCTNECRKAIDAYLDMRSRFGEDISNENAPLIREQFDRRDPFAIAHPKRINRVTLRKKLTEMAEAVGLRTRTQLASGERGPSQSQRKEIPITNGFRYHYITTLVNAKLPTEHRFLLEGHNLKYNDQFYVHVSHDDLYQSFMLAHDDLLIDQSHKLKREVNTLKERNNRLDAVLDRVMKLEKELGII